MHLSVLVVQERKFLFLSPAWLDHPVLTDSVNLE